MSLSQWDLLKQKSNQLQRKKYIALLRSPFRRKVKHFLLQLCWQTHTPDEHSRLEVVEARGQIASGMSHIIGSGTHPCTPRFLQKGPNRHPTHTISKKHGTRFAVYTRWELIPATNRQGWWALFHLEVNERKHRRLKDWKWCPVDKRRLFTWYATTSHWIEPVRVPVSKLMKLEGWKKTDAKSAACSNPALWRAFRNQWQCAWERRLFMCS